MKTKQSIFLFLSLFCFTLSYGQIKVNTSGNAIFGNYNTTEKGISVIDSCILSAAKPLKIVRASNNDVYLKRENHNNGIAISSGGMVRIGTDITNYSSNSALTVMAKNESQAIDIYQELDGTSGIRMWHAGTLGTPIEINEGNTFAVTGAGKVYSKGFYTSSGSSLKSNVKKISSPLLKVMQLQAGMYLYSLIVDGQIVDTKRMVLTK